MASHSIASNVSLENKSNNYITSRERLELARRLYAPITTPDIQYMQHTLRSVLEGGEFDMENAIITSDVGEECDDALMIRYILSRARAHFWVVLSGGLLSPDERLAHLKKLFPQYRDAHFGFPFGNITFIRDGEYVEFRSLK
jgi:hypothetical protein